MIRFKEYKDTIMANLKTMSRTANGIVDLSSSKDKANSMIVTDGDEAKNIAIKNYLEAIDFCYINKDRVFNSEADLKLFIIKIAATVNEGIVIEDKLLRTSESDIYQSVEELEKSFDNYIHELYKCFEEKDGLKAAALSEYWINLRGHYFADGCNKTSMLVSAYCLMRHNQKVITYESREDYYLHTPKTTEDKKEFELFFDYFKELYNK